MTGTRHRTDHQSRLDRAQANPTAAEDQTDHSRLLPTTRRQRPDFRLREAAHPREPLHPVRAVTRGPLIAAPVYAGRRRGRPGEAVAPGAVRDAAEGGRRDRRGDGDGDARGRHQTDRFARGASGRRRKGADRARRSGGRLAPEVRPGAAGGSPVLPRRVGPAPAYTPDGRSLVTLDHRAGSASGTPPPAGPIGRSATRPSGSASSPSRRMRTTLATDNSLSRLQLWDMATGRELRRWHEPREGTHSDPRFSPDGRTLAVIATRPSGDAKRQLEAFVELVDTTVPTEGRRRIEGGWTHLWHLRFSPDGRALATSGTIRPPRMGRP